MVEAWLEQPLLAVMYSDSDEADEKSAHGGMSVSDAAAYVQAGLFANGGMSSADLRFVVYSSKRRPPRMRRYRYT